MALAFHRTPFRPCRLPRRDNRQQRARRRGFCAVSARFLLPGQRHSTCFLRRRRPPTSCASARPGALAQSACSGSRNARRRRPPLLGCDLPAGRRTASPLCWKPPANPSAAARNQIFLVPVLFGKHRTVWEDKDRGARLSAVRPPRASRAHHRSRPATVRVERRQDPALLVACGHFRRGDQAPAADINGRSSQSPATMPAPGRRRCEC